MAKQGSHEGKIFPSAFDYRHVLEYPPVSQNPQPLYAQATCCDQNMCCPGTTPCCSRNQSPERQKQTGMVETPSSTLKRSSRHRSKHKHSRSHSHSNQARQVPQQPLAQQYPQQMPYPGQQAYEMQQPPYQQQLQQQPPQQPPHQQPMYANLPLHPQPPLSPQQSLHPQQQMHMQAQHPQHQYSNAHVQMCPCAQQQQLYGQQQLLQYSSAHYQNPNSLVTLYRKNTNSLLRSASSNTRIGQQRVPQERGYDPNNMLQDINRQLAYNMPDAEAYATALEHMHPQQFNVCMCGASSGARSCPHASINNVCYPGQNNQNNPRLPFQPNQPAWGGYY